MTYVLRYQKLAIINGHNTRISNYPSETLMSNFSVSAPKISSLTAKLSTINNAVCFYRASLKVFFFIFFRMSVLYFLSRSSLLNHNVFAHYLMTLHSLTVKWEEDRMKQSSKISCIYLWYGFRKWSPNRSHLSATYPGKMQILQCGKASYFGNDHMHLVEL